MLQIQNNSLIKEKLRCCYIHWAQKGSGDTPSTELKELTNYAEGATEFEKANLKLANEYKVVRNKRAERYAFRRRTQSQCESITEYIAALENMYNQKIRERLLADENIDLDKAIVIAVRLEIAIRDAKSMDPHRLSDDFDKSGNVVKYNKHITCVKKTLVAEIQTMINRRLSELSTMRGFATEM